MTLAQSRLIDALLSQIYGWAIENQDDLDQAYEDEMQGITDEVIINAVKLELGLD
jgi:hypothetical protein